MVRDKDTSMCKDDNSGASPRSYERYQRFLPSHNSHSSGLDIADAQTKETWCHWNIHDRTNVRPTPRSSDKALTSIRACVASSVGLWVRIKSWKSNDRPWKMVDIWILRQVSKDNPRMPYDDRFGIASVPRSNHRLTSL